MTITFSTTTNGSPRAGRRPAYRYRPYGPLPSVVAYCGRGERSTTALSILERAGLGPLMNIEGGVGAWKSAGFDLVRGAAALS